MRAQLILRRENELNKLTINEKKTLKLLLENSRITDVEIGEKLKVSSQAARKIRKKLEKLNVIKDYFADVDYSSLGISVFALALLNITKNKEDKICENLSKNVISLHKVFKNDISHIALLGFKDLQEMDDFLNEIYTSNSGEITVNRIFAFPEKGLVKNSQKDFLHNIIKEFGKEKAPFPNTNYPQFQKRESKREKKPLSENEKLILKHILNNSRISYKKMSGDLNNLSLTSRGISKIKERLEKRGIIKGYSIDSDFDKLGIKILSFIFLKNKEDYLSSQKYFEELSEKSYNVLGCYRINEDSLHVIQCAFRNIEELENYCHNLQNKELNIEKIYLSSNKGVLKSNNKEFFLNYLN